MRELGDIEAALLINEDGTVRDLNFAAPTWEGVQNLLNRLEASFGEISGADQDGCSISSPFAEGVLTAVKRANGFVILGLRGGYRLVKNLQLFVSAEDDGAPFVELTFFPPEDLEATQSLRDDFIVWVHELQTCLRARRCYARYEYAGWKLGDTFGVFFVSDGSCDDPPDGRRATG